MDTRTTISAFDAWLAERKVRFEAIVVGGAALNLLGVIQRETKAWPEHVRAVLDDLASRLGHAL